MLDVRNDNLTADRIAIARIVGMHGEGAVGDLAVWSLDGPSFAGAIADPVEAWLRCGPVVARHTVVAGRTVAMETPSRPSPSANG